VVRAAARGSGTVGVMAAMAAMAPVVTAVMVPAVMVHLGGGRP
jgi:H+/gluconate symporter-like permease